MSSLWNRLGVDWENPEDYKRFRTSDLIRDLHQATYELYYNAVSGTFIRAGGLGFIPTSPYNYDFYERDENAFYETSRLINIMFSDNPQLSQANKSGQRYFAYMGTACFIDNDTEVSGYPNFTKIQAGSIGVDRYLVNEYLYGIPYMTMTYLESIYGDLSVIRNRGIGSRVTVETLYQIYKIITHPKKLLINPPQRYWESFLGLTDYWGLYSASGAMGLVSNLGLRQRSTNNTDVRSMNQAISSMESNTPLNQTVGNGAFDPPRSTPITQRYMELQGITSSGNTTGSAQNGNIRYSQSFIGFDRRVGFPRDINEIKVDVIKFSYPSSGYAYDPNGDDFGILNDIGQPVNLTRVTDVGLKNLSVGISSGVVIDDDDLITGVTASDPPNNESYYSYISQAHHILVDVNTKEFADYYTEATN